MPCNATAFCLPIWIWVRIVSISIGIAFNTLSYASEIAEVPFLEGIDDNAKHHSLPARYALVIGIDRYSSARKVMLADLPSALKDADDVAKALKEKASFDVTLLTSNQEPNNYKPIRRSDVLFAVDALALRAKDSKQQTQRDPVILVYFAGHGLSDVNDDYIIPADFNPVFADDVPDMSISVTQILSRLRYANPSLRIVITDSCRNATPVTLPSLGQGNVSFVPGGSAAGSQKAVSNAEDGSALIYSTLKGNTAIGDGENGHFTGEFLEILDKVFSNIKTSDTTIYWNKSNLSELYQATYSLMDAKMEVKQLPEEVKAGPEFDFFPTAAKFSDERDLWDASQRIPNITGEVTDYFIHQRRYCLMKRFVAATSRTSFYGEEALKKLRNLEKVLTDDDDMSESELKSLCSEENNQDVVQRPRPSSTSSPLTGPTPAPVRFAPTRILNVRQSPSISAESKREVANFDPATTIDSLAVTLAPLNVYSAETANAVVTATLEAQVFVEVLSADGVFARVRTAKGQSGFIEQKLLSSATTLKTLDLIFRDGKLDEASSSNFSALLQQVIPIDALVQYRSGDGENGLQRAQDIALLLSQNQFSGSSATFVPKLSSSQSLSGLTVRLTITAFALDKGVRERIIVPNAISLTAQNAPVHADSVPAAAATENASAVLDENGMEGECRSLGETQRELGMGALAYIHYDGSNNQYALSARVIVALKTAGFRRGLAERTELPNLPQNRGEVRRCPQYPVTLSTAAINTLRSCGFGDYKAVTLPASVCQMTSTPRIEVWLAHKYTIEDILSRNDSVTHLLSNDSVDDILVRPSSGG